MNMVRVAISNVGSVFYFDEDDYCKNGYDLSHVGYVFSNA